jgi:hypothetical protein
MRLRALDWGERVLILGAPLESAVWPPLAKASTQCILCRNVPHRTGDQGHWSLSVMIRSLREING